MLHYCPTLAKDVEDKCAPPKKLTRLHAKAKAGILTPTDLDKYAELEAHACLRGTPGCPRRHVPPLGSIPLSSRGRAAVVAPGRVSPPEVAEMVHSDVLIDCSGCGQEHRVFAGRGIVNVVAVDDPHRHYVCPVKQIPGFTETGSGDFDCLICGASHPGD
jgi:hypothetical protein